MLPFTATEDSFDSLKSVRNRREKRSKSRERANTLIMSALQSLDTEPKTSRPTHPSAPSPIASPVAVGGPGPVTLPNVPVTSGPAEANLSKAIAELIKASGNKVKIVSGKRSTKRQAELYAAAIKKYGSEKAARKWVAPPGRSRHERGEAYDLGGDIALAAKLAPQFGLHRPMSWEPWHFELIGSRKGKK